MKNIQDIVNSGGRDIRLPSGEFKGPVIINKPCTLTGNSITLWNNSGSVIEIRSQGVKLCGIRAELTDNQSDLFCIQSYYPDTIFENIEISGRVKGVKNEELQWIMPRSISLGEFKADDVNTFIMEIYVPVEAELSTDISGLEISPSKLSKGRNKIILKVSSVRHGTFLYGEIIVKSLFIRRIYISGKSFSDAPCRQDLNLYTASEPELSENMETDFVALSDEREKRPDMKRLCKGERVYIDELADDIITVEFNCRKMLAPLEIDPYVFMLDKNGIVPDDNDFIFFSNPVSPNSEIRIQPSDNGGVSDVEINLRRVPQEIEKISISYSIYINNPNDNFSKVSDPFVSIRSNGNIKYFFSAEDLMMETTIIFLEIYRYNNSWKMNMVGSGYNNGLSRLCEGYGLKVGY